MTQYELNGYTLGVVEVPEGANGFEIQGFGDLLFYSYPNHKYPGLSDCNQHLSTTPGQWQLIGPGLASEIREGDIPEGLVSTHTAKYTNGDVVGYLDYEYNEKEPVKELADVHYIPFDTRLASLHSYLRSQGYLKLGRICLLIKK